MQSDKIIPGEIITYFDYVKLLGTAHAPFIMPNSINRLALYSIMKEARVFLISRDHLKDDILSKRTDKKPETRYLDLPFKTCWIEFAGDNLYVFKDYNMEFSGILTHEYYPGYYAEFYFGLSLNSPRTPKTIGHVFCRDSDLMIKDDFILSHADQSDMKTWEMSYLLWKMISSANQSDWGTQQIRARVTTKQRWGI